MFTAHCSYRLKFHLRNSSFNNRRLPGTRFARSTRPSQRSKYTEGVAQRMRRCVAIQRLSRKCVQKKNTPDVEALTTWQQNVLTRTNVATNATKSGT